MSGFLYHARENGEPWTSCPLLPCGGLGEQSCCESCQCSGCEEARATGHSCERDADGFCVERLDQIGRVGRSIQFGRVTDIAASFLASHGLTLPRLPQLARAVREARSYQEFLAAGLTSWYEANRAAGQPSEPSHAHGGERKEQAHGASNEVVTPVALRLAMQAEMLRYVVSELPHAVALHEAARNSSGCVVPLCLSWFMNGSLAFRQGVDLVLHRLGVNDSASLRVQNEMARHDISSHPTSHSTSKQTASGSSTALVHERLNRHLRVLASSLDEQILGGWLGRQSRRNDAYASAHACASQPLVDLLSFV